MHPMCHVFPGKSKRKFVPDWATHDMSSSLGRLEMKFKVYNANMPKCCEKFDTWH